ncbi:hypothetical protein pb186bvf_007624 [Paramecium bursaria]
MIFLFIGLCHAIIDVNRLTEFYNQYTPIDFDVESGYQSTQSKNSIFYQLAFQVGKTNLTVNSDDPLIIWLQGGPGCSSQIGFFNEIGPFYIQDNKVYKRTKSWNSFASLLFVDQPFKSGFSYGSIKVENVSAAGDYFISFLQEFITLHSEFKDSPIYLAGEEYAGHFILQFSSILKVRNFINNFKGIILGNPFIDTFSQISYQSSFLFQNGFTNIDQRAVTKQQDARTQQLILNKNYKSASENYAIIMKQTFNIENYQINFSQEQQWYNFMIKYSTNFKLPSSESYNVCLDTIKSQFLLDWTASYSEEFIKALQDYRILIFNGQFGYKNTAGGIQQFLSTLRSERIEEWKKETKQIFKYQGNTVGSYKQTSFITFVEIYNTGSNSIMENQDVTHAMMEHFLNNDNIWI